jgi:hypothetical protein
MGKNRHDEAEGGGVGACGLGYDLMERGRGEATLRQMGIERGKAKGKRPVPILLHRYEQTAQFFHHRGTISRAGKSWMRL